MSDVIHDYTVLAVCCVNLLLAPLAVTYNLEDPIFICQVVLPAVEVMNAILFYDNAVRSRGRMVDPQYFASRCLWAAFQWFLPWEHFARKGILPFALGLSRGLSVFYGADGRWNIYNAILSGTVAFLLMRHPPLDLAKASVLAMLNLRVQVAWGQSHARA